MGTTATARSDAAHTTTSISTSTAAMGTLAIGRSACLAGCATDAVTAPADAVAVLYEGGPAVLARIRDAESTRDPAVVQASRDNFAVLMQSLGKLNRAGARIITGPDTGLPDNFFAYSEQRERSSSRVA